MMKKAVSVTETASQIFARIIPFINVRRSTYETNCIYGSAKIKSRKLNVNAISIITAGYKQIMTVSYFLSFSSFISSVMFSSTGTISPVFSALKSIDSYIVSFLHTLIIA